MNTSAFNATAFDGPASRPPAAPRRAPSRLVAAAADARGSVAPRLAAASDRSWRASGRSRSPAASASDRRLALVAAGTPGASPDPRLTLTGDR